MFFSTDKNKKAYRCVIYTRLSDQEKSEVSAYDSIEAQRELSEQYIGIHVENNWSPLPDRYDDRNYSGGTLNRPALKRLLEDAKAGKFDMVVVKSIDRLTRSLQDFYKLWEVFKEYNIELSSATQEFNTASSAGRLHLTIVLSFAQYERELASERTKAKMDFRARKGLFHGGNQLLGFDFTSVKGVLKHNLKEIPLVRLIFRKYAEIQSGNLVAKFCNENGYVTKIWKSASGLMRGGKKFTEVMIMNLLKNPYFLGKTQTSDGCYHAAQWKGIVSPKLFERVQQIIKKNTVRRHAISQNKHRLLLIGLVWCGHCGSQMTHNSAVKKGKTYLYYQCTKVGHADKTACIIRRISARALETLVIKRLQFLSERPNLIEKITKAAVRMAKRQIPILRGEKNRITSQLQKIEREAAPLMKAIGKKKLSILQEKLMVLDSDQELLKAKMAEIDEQMVKEKEKVIDPAIVCQNLRYFDAVFEQLPFEKQRDLMNLLIKKIVYHKDPSKLVVSLYNLPEIKKPPKQSSKTGSGGSSLSSRFDERMYWLPRVGSNHGQAR